MLLTLVFALLVTGCGLRSASGAVLEAKPGTIQHYDSLEGVPITVTAKDFTEQLILGNMVSIILNAAGADVTNMTNTPGSFGVRQAMLDGTANVSPEYTGTGWINYMGNEQPIKDPVAQWQAVDEADKANNLTWLPPAPMNNTYAFAIRESEAQRLGVTKLSDLSRLPRHDLTFCVESEFANRNDGFVPMLQTYGLTRGDLGRVTHLDTGVIYTATANGDCNFGEVFTTDGRIPTLNLRVLEDDKQFFPLYNLTEVIATDLLDAHPELAEIFAQLNPRLTNETMMMLNAKVDSDGDDPAIVARDWLIEQRLLT
ncbi:glycine betaine ABC transporter substrate-binding protein [Mycolicibacterium setense]|uniref:Glycine/betaine ABC transporter substrate-binding protein n=1 Tax=Mycolicibacterium setense TaxID=431269 RepID=A0ABR4YWX8_9MYCO|nr:glycine betaine ABC transporter substrate-binding protein [Mycolicibacterium setense]KHO22313.1 glycine/betaine ABC transporter substrate-binding protein [Mycolicibacterium setense]KHO26751.1 glycine/betaine ABC transporter substrate-binding protein [Mycolicibacterium setense]MCV7114099.1 glycine betaine ABC transporter substrate-binding protein [Mycolicibacterium setense]